MGVPTSYSWYGGSTGGGSAPPSNFTSVQGWGQIYPEAGMPVDSGASVQIANFETYVHLTNGSWVLLQNEATSSIAGAHYLADFSGNSSVPWSETKLSDGSVSVDAPQSGYNDHFWPGGVRPTYAAGTVDGVFVEAEMKTNDPNANLIANLGADWWLSPTASFVSGFSNNPGAGMSDWVKLTTNYQTLYFSSLSAAQLQADPPPGLASSTTPTPPITPAVTQATASPATGIEHAGNVVTLTLGFNEAVTVTGTPTLSLNDGNTATYVSGSGTSALTFKTTVASTDTNTSALAITGVNLPSGTSIKDGSGVAASLSGAVKTFSGLQIDPVLPAVTQATASPATGTEVVGNTITLTLGFNEAVTVTGTPTLSLNDGDSATYVGGSGTSALTFKTTVASTDTNTSALAITGVNLANGASIHDASGVAANLAGAVKTFSGLQIDPPIAPPAVSPAVTQATASPGTGTEVVGNTITLTLGFNEAMTVTGTPTLSLNDGDTATYVGGSGTSALTFKTTVASTDTNTSALAVTGVNLANGASIHDASGAAANLAGAVKTFSGLQVATSSTSPSTPSSIAPVLTVADSTLSVSGRGGTVGLGVNVTTTDPNDAVTVNITGLPKYETITDKLDGQTFRGNNVTLTAAEVDSGLVLQSNYRGGGHPVATLTLTAAGKDPSTGATTTSASRTITVTDPRTATGTTTTSPQTITVTDPTPATDTTTASPAGKGFAWLGQHQDQAASVATAEPQAINPLPATIGSLANHGFGLLQQHLDGVTGAAPISVPQTIPEMDSASATGRTTASLASQSFALLNQYMAGNTGRVDPGQIVAAVSSGANWSQDSFLTRPH